MIQGQVVGLFPTPLGRFKLPPLTKAEYKFIFEQNKRVNRSNKISVTKSILEDKCMASFKTNIEHCLALYLKEAVSSDPNLKLRITQSWSNYTGVGEQHHQHCHANSVISGVYYVQTLDTDSINFHDKERSSSHWELHPPELHPYNAPTWTISTPQEWLMLFPSQLSHSVSDRQLEDKNAPDRISISFNTFYTGEIGDDGGATKLFL